MQNKKIFITGAGGFIGSHLLMQLMRDSFSCTAMYRNNICVVKPSVLVQGELNHSDTYESYLRGTDVIVHAAGFSCYDNRFKKKLLHDNYYATRALVDCALSTGIQNMIYISAASTLTRALYPTRISVGLQGSVIYNSYYDKTKFLAELELHRAAAEGMNICILYPGLVIGNGDWNSGSMQIFDKVKSGLSYYPPGNLGLVTVEDLASIVSQICISDICGQQMLVVAEAWSYKHFLNEIAECLQLKKIANEATFTIAKTMLIASKLRSVISNNPSMITRETVRKAFTKFEYDTSNVNSFLPLFQYRDIRNAIHNIVENHLKKSD